MADANAQAYYDTPTIVAIKGFIVEALGLIFVSKDRTTIKGYRLALPVNIRLESK